MERRIYVFLTKTCALENTRCASTWGDTSTYQAIFGAYSTLYLLSTVYDASAKSRQVQWDSSSLSSRTTFSTFQWTLWGRHKLDWKCFYPRSGGVIWLFSAIDAKRWTLIYSAQNALKKVSVEVSQMGNK